MSKHQHRAVIRSLRAIAGMLIGIALILVQTHPAFIAMLYLVALGELLRAHRDARESERWR